MTPHRHQQQGKRLNIAFDLQSTRSNDSQLLMTKLAYRHKHNVTESKFISKNSNQKMVKELGKTTYCNT
ncbi:hypothetical protein D0962_27895 [Leptolyngbyaceae cyanobacterium CCMR0082]|uniref:Uncharacterized protein n=1 Tax=Adonisia turfae CCMR0082 TaxID=2304604 RepID=A0A6M0SDH2_9CYAN|nr:hypothetical protein [Adonisia turfae CCMR0082]